MARLIDADEFLKNEIKRCGCVPLIGSCTSDNEIFKFILDQQPTVDAVEVVRCKDCKYRDPENGHCDHYMGTAIPLTRRLVDFCSYGEKMDGGDEE